MAVAQCARLYGTFIYAPSQRINVIPYFAAVALGYQGPFPGRDNDLAAFALYYGAFSRYLPGQTSELVLDFRGITREIDNMLIGRTIGFK